MNNEDKKVDVGTVVGCLGIVIGVCISGIFTQQVANSISGTYEVLKCKIRTSGQDASEVEVNYIKLCELLADNKFEEANAETTKMLISVAAKAQKSSEGSLLTNKDVNNLPCKDLNTVDKLWQIHSGGKFGFTPQKEIWIKAGSNLGEYSFDTYNSFAKEVGWKADNKFKSLTDKDFGYDLGQAKGHLPLLSNTQSLDVLSTLFVRLECTRYYSNQKT